jgi:hypothetical protein
LPFVIMMTKGLVEAGTAWTPGPTQVATKEGGQMTADQVRTLRSLEGRRVALALADGSRIDACTLVSAGRGPTATLWIDEAGNDVFVPLDVVVDIWEVDPALRRASCVRHPGSHHPRRRHRAA